MDLEKFIIDKLEKTEFYDKNENMFYQCASVFVDEKYVDMHIEDLITTFVGQYAFQRNTESDYKISTEHVFESPGLDIYITFISYAEYNNGEVKLDSCIIISYCC